MMVSLGKPGLLWENRKSKLARKLIEPRNEGKRVIFPRSLGICFKAKLKQEGNCDFKQGFKVKDPIQTLLLYSSYCDGNDMLCGKQWFYLEWRKKPAMIDVPYEGQTAKSLTF